MPPPQQKPTAPTLPFDSLCAARNGTAAAIRETVCSRSRPPIISRALSSSAGVPPAGAERIDGKGKEAVDGQPPADVADVRVEAAVLVDHEHRGPPAGGLQPHERAAHPRAGGVVAGRLGGEPRVVLADHCRLRIVVLQDRQQRGGSRRSSDEPGEAVDELSARQHAVRVRVVEVDDHPGPSAQPPPGAAHGNRPALVLVGSGGRTSVSRDAASPLVRELHRRLARVATLAGPGMQSLGRTLRPEDTRMRRRAHAETPAEKRPARRSCAPAGATARSAWRCCPAWAARPPGAAGPAAATRSPSAAARSATPRRSGRAARTRPAPPAATTARRCACSPARSG